MSSSKIDKKHGICHKWVEMVEKIGGLPEYFLREGKGTKTDFTKGLIVILLKMVSNTIRLIKASPKP